MPGLVGLVTAMPRARAEAELHRMVATLRHESFYVSGTWIDESQGVYVGWVARRESFAARMPVTNETRDAVLMFAGEEFPDPAQLRDLKAAGHAFDEDGAAYLVHAYEDDRSFPATLNGRFHGCLVDRARGVTKLFNDRYGMQRLYVHQSGDAFYFAAEAKAILAVRPELRRMDARGFGEFVACGCVLEDRTLFDGIRLLPPASSWTFRRGALDEKSTYFRPWEWEEQPAIEPEPYFERIRDVFSSNLPRYFREDGGIAVSLTGGFDTRAIMAWRWPAPRTLPCYTFGGMFRDSRDVAVARRVAALCRQRHDVIRVDGTFLSRFPEYAERSVYLTDGTVDVSRAADLFVNERARQIAPIRMTGNLGDEVLRQTPAFKPIAGMPESFSPDFLPHVREACSTYHGVRRGHPLSFAAFRQAPWHHHGVLALEETQVAMRSPFLDNDLVRTVYSAPPSAIASNDVRLRLIHAGNPALARVRTDRGFAGASLASRVSRTIHEFTFRAEYACDYGVPRIASGDRLVSALRLHRLFHGRHKFYHFAPWYRGELSGYVRDLLLGSQTLSRPYLDAQKVRATVDSHLSGARNCTAEINRLLTLELLHRLFFDRAIEPPVHRDAGATASVAADAACVG